MKARAVHAVLAAGVRRPHLIDEWAADPETLRRHGLAPESVDAGALRRFAGLTAKVRHNGARNLLPLSFRFLAAAGLELELFADYASECSRAGREFAGGAAERCDELMAYIEQWLDVSERDQALFWDLLRHEYAAVAPRRDTGGAEDAEGGKARPEAVARVRGELQLHEMRSDPRELAAAMGRREPRWEEIELSPHYYGYWRAPGEEAASLLELDEFSFYALRFMDGQKTVAELHALLGGAGAPDAAFLGAMEQLAGAGIARFAR